MHRHNIWASPGFPSWSISCGQYEPICAAAVHVPAADMTVVFEAGRNCGDNFARLAGTGLHYTGSVPASDCPDLTALPPPPEPWPAEQWFGALTAFGTRRVGYGTERRAILTHSPELHAAQARGLEGTTLAKACRKLDELAATLARGTTPPQQGQGGSRDHRDHGQALGPPRHHLAAGRRAAQGPAPGLGHRHRCPRGAGRRNLRQARADHQP